MRIHTWSWRYGRCRFLPLLPRVADPCPIQGDYVLVRGEMDEDKFYFGENVATGQSGLGSYLFIIKQCLYIRGVFTKCYLVPSNYIERVSDQFLLSNASRTPSSSPVQRRLQRRLTDVSTMSTAKSVATQSPPTSSRRKQMYEMPRELMSDVYASTSYQQPTTLVHFEPTPQVRQTTTTSYNGDGRSINSPSFPLTVPSYHSSILHDFTDTSSSNEVATNPPLPPKSDTASGSISWRHSGATRLPTTNLPSMHRDQSLPEDVCPYPPVDVSLHFNAYRLRLLRSILAPGLKDCGTGGQTALRSS